MVFLLLFVFFFGFLSSWFSFSLHIITQSSANDTTVAVVVMISMSVIDMFLFQSNLFIGNFSYHI